MDAEGGNPPGRRRCPRDGEQLARVNMKVGRGVEVDTCPQCAGFFLDRDEVRELTGDADLNEHLKEHAWPVAEHTLGCPACAGPMDATEASGVVVDVCARCLGIWFDGGELPAVRAKSVRVPVQEGPRRRWLAGVVGTLRR